MELSYKLLLNAMLFLAILLASTMPCIAQMNDLDELRVIFSKNDAFYFYLYPKKITKPVQLAFDLGERALPLLENVLSQTDREKTELAAYCIAIIGGPKARDILKKSYPHLIRGVDLKTLLYFTLPSTGEKDDVDLLIQSIQKNPSTETRWQQFRQAAFSLGVLRTAEVKIMLQQIASKKPGYASELAEDALFWHNGDIWTTSPEKNDSINDSIIHTLLRFGIPRLSENTVFIESAANRVWYRKDKNWTHESKPESIDHSLPLIGFEVHIAPDQTRAICRVGITFGPLNENGYDFLLKKKDGVWEVIGFRDSWIS